MDSNLRAENRMLKEQLEIIVNDNQNAKYTIQELIKANETLSQENKQLKEEKKKAREFIYRYWITYDESKNFTKFNEELIILIKEIKELLEILGDKE